MMVPIFKGNFGSMIRVGKIVATHGLNGAVVLTHIMGDSQWLKKGTALMVEMQKGSYIPYFVAQCKASNNEEYIVNIEEIEKIESAKKLIAKQVYVDSTILSAYIRQSPLLWIGFGLIDKNEGNIGTVEDVLQTGKQWIAKTTYKDKEVLIPLIEQTIGSIDTGKKILNIEIPDGLLDVYLNS
jgi:16S rRNA processing protein RimM